jgi:hypothetical protein
MEYPHSVFMFRVKQGILYDLVTEKWLKLMYVKKYVFYKILVFDKMWYNFMGLGKKECKGIKNTKRDSSYN